MTISIHKQTEVSIDDIQIGDRRPADPEKVQRYSESIQEIGLLHPIGLTRDFRLIHGLHRLEACRELKWEKIPAVVRDLDSLHAELVEIDENLMRSGLDAIDLGEALVRRKELHKQLDATRKHGGDRKSKAAKSSGNSCHLMAFADEVAQKTEWSARTVRHYVTVVERIPHDLRKQLRNTVVGKKITELEKISTLPEADQRAVVERIVGGARSVVDAIKAIEEPHSPEMRKIIAAKQTTSSNGAKKEQAGEGAPPRRDTDDKASAVEQPEEVPSEEDRATADAPAAPVTDSEPSTEIGTELPAESLASDDQALDDEQSDAADPVSVYRDFLLGLPGKIRFLYEHFDDVVGKALDSSAAVEVLQKAVRFFEAARDAESEMAGQPAEMDRTPGSV